jgi:hypothetical protein
MLTRIGLVILAALLALPIAPTASPVEAKKRPRSVTKTFSNTAPIGLLESEASPGPGSVYPSPIAVGGLKGTIRDVNLTLHEDSHDFSENIEVLLVGPHGQTVIVMAHVGSFYDADDVTLRLDDEAARRLPADAALESGAYRPRYVAFSPGERIDFTAPAPSAGPNAALSVFDGTKPNGAWRLFVQDLDGPSDFGEIAGGWEIEITTQVKGKKRR